MGSGEDDKHTPESVMLKLEACETEMGQQVEALREELQEYKESFDSFVKDFTEMLKIFKNAKGFFTVLGWIGKAARWTVLTAIAIGSIIAGFKSGMWK